ncbi:MAG: hypothetical protein ACR2GC_11550 [Methyloceanibacter sp.]|uniref:bestrophin-like domain n=1 Tax=Methyloceanibacter sp. TaxID=1965321 RepID=UPI003D9BE8E2
MSLIEFVNDTPFWLSLLIVTGGAILYSVGLMLLVRYFYGVDRLSLNNEVAGFKFAVVGVFYGLLLAFVVIAVWEEFRDTESAVRDEAKAVVDLHRVAHALGGVGGNQIRAKLAAYIDDVQEHEWPAMSLGNPSRSTAEALDRLSQEVFQVQPQHQREFALYQEALRLLGVITDNRTERLDGADGSMPGILWLVLIIGGIVTLSYPAFFASTSLGAQMLMTASLAGLVALAFLLTLYFNFPFTGDVSLSPAPFVAAEGEMGQDWFEP